MKFTATSRADFNADLVVQTLIYGMDDLVPHMPNVAEIDTHSIEPRDDGTIKTVRRWQGTASSVPALIRPFVTKNSLAWMDYAIWTPSSYSCEWYIESKNSKFSSCSGVNIFRPHADDPEGATELVIDGDFTVFGDKLPGMPGFLGRRVAPSIEKIIVGFMLPNFKAMAVGIASLLGERAARGLGPVEPVAIPPASADGAEP